MDNLEENKSTATPEDNKENSQNTLADSKDDAKKDPEKFEKERYNQQMQGKQQQIERTRAIALETAVKLVKADWNELLELHKKDPGLANDVVRKLWYDSYEEAIELAWLNKKNDKDDDEDFDTKYKKKRAEEEHDKALKKADKAFTKLDTEEKEKAQKYFEKITKWHSLDSESVEEFIEMATLFVQKDKLKGSKYEKAKEDFYSWNISKSSKASWDGDEPYIKNGKLVYPSNNK